MKRLCRSAPRLWATLLTAAATLHAQQTCSVPANLKVSQNTADGAGLIGNWFSSHGQARCAVEAYRHGIQVAPSSAALHYSLGVALVALQQSTSAQAELEQAIRLDPSLDRAYLVLGVIAHDHGDRDAALRAWHRAMEINPASTMALDWIAKTRIESGQYTAAADLLRTAPLSEDLAIDLLIADSKATLYLEAMASARRALAAHPDWRRLRIALATTLVQRNQFQEATDLLLALLRQEPEAFDVQVLYLKVLVLMGDAGKAEPYAQQLMASHAHDFDVLYLNGLLKRQAGEYAAALELLQAAHVLRPDHFDVQFNLGVTLAKLHHLAEAKERLTRAEGLAGASPEVHFQLAGVLRSMGEAEAADDQRKLYQQQLAERAARDELISLSAQASQKLASGDAVGAVTAEQQIVSKFPNDAVHWYDLGLALDAVGDAKQEVQALQHAVQLRPGFAVALNQLGYLQARAGEAGQAEQSFRKALVSAPQYAEAENNLGSLLAEQGRDTEAEQYFRSALEANPRFTDAWINLAASLAAKGSLTEARHAAESAMLIQPGNHDAQQLLVMLQGASAMPKSVAK